MRDPLHFPITKPDFICYLYHKHVYMVSITLLKNYLKPSLFRVTHILTVYKDRLSHHYNKYDNAVHGRFVSDL